MIKFAIRDPGSSEYTNIDAFNTFTYPAERINWALHMMEVARAAGLEVVLFLTDNRPMAAQLAAAPLNSFDM